MVKKLFFTDLVQRITRINELSRTANYADKRISTTVFHINVLVRKNLQGLANLGDLPQSFSE
jgi:hypothetical protein